MAIAKVEKRFLHHPPCRDTREGNFSRPRPSASQDIPGRIVIGAPFVVADLVVSSDPSATIDPGPFRPMMRAVLPGSLTRGTLF